MLNLLYNYLVSQKIYNTIYLKKNIYLKLK